MLPFAIKNQDKTSGHFTAQCKIKDSYKHWIKYNNTDFESNNFINQRYRTKAKVKYHPLAYFLFYIKRDPAVSPEIGLQVQDNDGVSLNRLQMLMRMNNITVI